MNKSEFRSQLIKAPEFRSYATDLTVRTERAENGQPLPDHIVLVEGYASITDTPYEMYDMFGEYTEVIRSGAFKKTLEERADVAFLVNHGGLTMARTTTGALDILEDERGLKTVAALDSRRNDVHDLLLSMERGDTNEMSFAFMVMDQRWNEDFDHRTITEVSLHRGDVSAVNYGANPNTVIGARSFPHARDAQLAMLAQKLELGEDISPEQRAQLARIVRSLPVKDVTGENELAKAGDDLAGLNHTLALKDLLDLD